MRKPVTIKAAPRVVCGKRRSPKWDEKERAFLKAHPRCEACGSKLHLEVHHKQPFHLRPDLELVDSNLMTLCRADHFAFGHLHEWESYNPAVVVDVKRYRQKVKNRPKSGGS